MGGLKEVGRDGIREREKERGSRGVTGPLKWQPPVLQGAGKGTEARHLQGTRNVQKQRAALTQILLVLHYSCSVINMQMKDKKTKPKGKKKAARRDDA